MQLPLKRQKELILSVLEAHLYDGTPFEVPWGITAAGWEAYARHWSAGVRAAVQKHPQCPAHLREYEKKTARA